MTTNADTMGGRIINDHYDKEAYVRRRVGFLDRTGSRGPLFSLVRREAEEVFLHPEALSVQAVYAREIACEISPLLPLPTDSNIETLDEFAGYPATEWTPGAFPAPLRLETASPDPVQEQGPSSLARRPVAVPVKTRGAKRPRGEDDTPSETSSEDEETPAPPPPPAKRPRLTINGPKANDKGKGRARDGETEIDLTNNAKALKATTSRVDRIARGEIVSKSKQEAIQAQALRKQHLLAEITKSKNKKSKRRGTPDPMPEFFEITNFTDDETADGPIRCVCGATSDDLQAGEQWVGCSGEECGGCWQHVACLGDAVPIKKADRESEDYDYYCQLCDPHLHRKTLQKIRRGETIEH